VTRRRCVRALLLVVAAIAVVGGGVSAAAPQPTSLVPGNASVAGRAYGQWVATDYRWRLWQPNITSKTSCFTAGQHGPVWFLGGGYTNAEVITRSCAVPAGRYLMWATPSYDCSTAERGLHSTDDAGLLRCARADWQSAPGFETVTLDGRQLQPPGYVGGTTVFAFKMPAHNNWLEVQGRTHGRMAVYGMASILPPLTPGSHTLEVAGGFSRSTTTQVTYHLTVG
jgi:hypothetical protein